MRQRWPLVLMYHGIIPRIPGKDSHDLFVIFQDDFERHLRLLKRFYRLLHPDELADALEKGKPVPPRSALVTLDDGYQNILDYALPVAETLRVPLLAFVATGHLDDGEWLWFSRCFAMLLAQQGRIEPLQDWWPGLSIQEIEAELERMGAPRRADATQFQRLLFDGIEKSNLIKASRSPYFCVGGHTIRHPRLVDEMPHQRLAEIVDNRRALQEITGQQVRLFAYPEGLFDQDTARQVRQAGYVGAFAASHLDEALPHDLRNYQIPRTGIFRPGRLRFWFKCWGVNTWPSRIQGLLGAGRQERLNPY